VLDSLREADRRKDEFLAMLAHELRNPLAPIRNAAEIVKLLAPPAPNLQQAREAGAASEQELADSRARIDACDHLLQYGRGIALGPRVGGKSPHQKIRLQGIDVDLNQFRLRIHAGRTGVSDHVVLAGADEDDQIGLPPGGAAGDPGWNVSRLPVTGRHATTGAPLRGAILREQIGLAGMSGVE